MVFQNDILAGASGTAAGYSIDQSIRFDKTASSRLQLTQGTPDGTSWTLSWWMKRGKIDASEMWFINGGNAYPDYIRFETSEKIRFRIFSRSIDNTTTAVFRDPSAWYHFVANWNGSTGAYNLWQNNVSLISGTGSSGETYYNKSGEFFSLGSQGGGGNYYDGYLSEIVKLDNTVADPTSFGEYNDSGVWVPKAYTGTYGTNGFYITGEDSADLGADYSGNGNDFTSSGLAAADQVTDTPTDNYCTISPLDSLSFTPTASTISDGNLQVSFNTSSNFPGVRSTMAVDASGDHYFEVTVGTNTGAGMEIGIVPPTVRVTSGYLSSVGAVARSYRSNGQKWNGSAYVSYGDSYTTGDVIGLRLNSGSLYGYKNGTIQNSGTPLETGLTGEYAAGGNHVNNTGGSEIATFNFGQSSFSALPAGSGGWSTSRLSAPTITDGSAYFQTTLYTGNGTTNEINQIGNSTFQPDFVWAKSRSAAQSHRLADAIRGSAVLFSDLTNAEDTTAGISFDADGFSWTNSDGSNANDSGVTYAGWQWLAANGTASNGNGSITSTVSANTTAGFSIVGYTGNGTAGATVGHGLGVKPSMLICKNRDNTEQWIVYQEDQGATKYGLLNSTATFQSSSGAWNNTEPTSSVVTLGGGGFGTNVSSNDMIMYAFAEVEGFSKFGSYTGNGSTDGPFVWCGFRPAFVIFKKSSGADSWELFDNTRPGYNATGLGLFPNTASAEVTGRNIDILSNGIKQRNANGTTNQSGSTYIFMAFAEHPFGGDGVAPVPAR